MCRADTHPTFNKIVLCHSMSVIGNLDAVTVNTNVDFGSVGIETVLHEFGKCDVVATDQSLT